jgi:hypothetical protein
MIRGGRGICSKLIAIVTVATGLMIGSAEPVAAEGTICGDYTLPPGAQVHQLGSTVDADGNRLIIIEYGPGDGPGTGPSPSGLLKIPFDTIAVTCAHPTIRAAVLHYQQFARDIIQASCKFVGDLLAGRVQLPPEKAAHYDRKFAEEWYRKTCLGNN